MKILLVQSYLKGNLQPVFPMGLACLAGCLTDHELRVLDLNLYEQPFNVLENTLADFKPDVIGISLRNIDNVIRLRLISFYEDYEYTVKKIKEISPNSALVAGGPGFSMFARDIMERNPDIDYGIFQ